jgi:plastocyanin
MSFLRSNWMRVAGFAFAGALILLAGACSEGGKGDTVRQTPVEGTTTEGGVVLDISAREFSFVPDRVQVRPGQVAEIRLHNDGSEKHSLSVYEDDEYTKLVEGAAVTPAAPGETKSVTLNPPRQDKELYFRCEIHPDKMKGTIEIGPEVTAKP